MTLRWTSMTDVDREREYSPSSCLADGDYQPYVVHYRQASDAAWSRVRERSEASTHAIAFGDFDTRTIDVAVPASDQPVPLLAFIHGGYWQELTAADSRFAADACLARGWGFAAIDYTLAPDASLDQIVEECRRAVRSLADRAESLGVDATRLVLAGSSAGAHLAAMAAINSGEDGPERAGTNTGVAGVVLVSGIFELEPLIGTSINEQLGLDRPSAQRNSPLGLDVAGIPTALVAYGSDETSEFKAQSDAFGRHLEAAGTAVSMLEIAGRNHFDVILDLAEPDTPLGDAVERLMCSL